MKKHPVRPALGIQRREECEVGEGEDIRQITGIKGKIRAYLKNHTESGDSCEGKTGSALKKKKKKAENSIGVGGGVGVGVFQRQGLLLGIQMLNNLKTSKHGMCLEKK